MSTTSSVRTGMVIAGLALFSGGCFALFSLDDYGPVDDPLLSSDGGDSDVVVASDVVVVDAPPSELALTGRIVFLTSTKHDGALNGAAGGAGEADKICQDLAAAAGINGSFKAWLSDMQSSPRQRFTRFNNSPDAGDPSLRFVTPDRRAVIASGFYELSLTGPRMPIAMTEKREKVAAPTLPEVTCNPDPPNGVEVVWTATAQDGDRAGQQDCSKWQAANPGNQAQAGAVVGPDSGKKDEGRRLWTAACQPGCNTKAHFYCFEQ